MRNHLILAVLFGLIACASGYAQQEIISPLVGEKEVTFSMYAPAAREVTVHGSWMNPDDNCYGTPVWTPEIEVVKMKKGRDGVWSCSVPVPSCDLWTYNFYVDGVYVLDPANKFVQWDGTRELSVLLIEGDVTFRRMELWTK